METNSIIKGRDLPGAVKVVPEGLSEMIAKREFSEFKMKESSFCTTSSHTMESSSSESHSFSTSNNNNSIKKGTTQVSTAEDRARFSADMTSKCSGTYKPFSQETFEVLQHEEHHHGSEICQENLKSTIQSAINDLESDLNFSHDDGAIETEANGLPELAPLSPSLPKTPSEPTTILNSISNSLLETNQPLKRRNPRLMFTDSSFYNPKHHPSIAEQVEMAHRLSSALYNDHEGAGQEMFLKRAQKSTNWIYSEGKENDFANNDTILQKHITPNLKLVMNPDGKTLDYNDLMQDDLPPSNPLTPEIASSVVKNLEGCKLFSKRRKKASNWIVDGDNVGKSEDYVVIQQENCGQTSAEKMSVRERFEDDMKQKQDQSLEMRMSKRVEDSILDDMPTTTNLRSSMPSNSFAEAHGLDWSIHNSQGIDVWMSNIPKSWASFNQKRPIQDVAKQDVIKFNKSAVENVKKNSTQFSSNIEQEMNYEESSSNAVEAQTPTTTTTIDPDLEREKREEYELWFKNQERQQELLEYDCLVKYMEKKDADSLMMQHPKECYQNHQENVISSSETFHQSDVQKHATLYQEQEVVQQQSHFEDVVQHQAGHQLLDNISQPQKEVVQQQSHFEDVVQQQAGHALLNNFEAQKEVVGGQFEDVVQQQAGHALLNNFEAQKEVVGQFEDVVQQQAGHQLLNNFEAQKEAHSFHPSGDLTNDSTKAEPIKETFGQWNQKVEEPKQEKVFIPLAPPEPAKPLINLNAIKKPSPSRSSFGREVSSKKSSPAMSVQSTEEVNSIDYEKRSVRNLVDRFSKTRPGQLPPQYLPQQYSQSCGFEPPLNYLKIKDSESDKKIPKVKKSPVRTNDESEKKAALLEAAERARKEAAKNRASVSEFLLMGEETSGTEMQSAVEESEDKTSHHAEESQDILDPSKLLDVENLYPGAAFRSKLSLDENPLSSEINKWDNHNTIARGWISTPNYSNYVPVTFRKKYHVETQKPLEINSQ